TDSRRLALPLGLHGARQHGHGFRHRRGGVPAQRRAAPPPYVEETQARAEPNSPPPPPRPHQQPPPPFRRPAARQLEAMWRRCPRALRNNRTLGVPRLSRACQRALEVAQGRAQVHVFEVILPSARVGGEQPIEQLHLLVGNRAVPQGAKQFLEFREILSIFFHEAPSVSRYWRMQERSRVWIRFSAL